MELDEKTLKERVLDEINKGVRNARNRGVIVPRDVNEVDIVPIPVRDDEED